MSELARSLRRQMDGGFPHGNPLVNIGVSADVLDLGLTEDELYDYLVKGVARQLVIRIHPDRVGADKRPDLEILQRKYVQAHEDLQDRATFVRALAEFRNLKAEDRSEMRILRRALEDARRNLDSYREKEVSLVKGEARLRLDRQSFDKIESTRKLHVARLEADLASVNDRFDSENDLSLLRQKKYEDVLRYISYLGGGSDRFCLGVDVFRARWVIVASLVPSFASDVPMPTKTVRWTADFLRSIEHLGIPNDELKSILELWKRRFVELNTPNMESVGGTFSLRMHVLEISAGFTNVVFGWNSNSHLGERVIGSVPVSPKMPVGRNELVRLLEKDKMFYHLVPFLKVGGLLVSERVKKVKNTGIEGSSYVHIRRETKRIILGVG